jgi:putative metallohydrolase (TIGR04338 family)
MASVPLRRFRRFADIEAYVEQVVLSAWWSESFPSAPLEVEVLRRSRSATFSAAATTGDEVGLLALVDGHGWGLETVLHELAHLVAGAPAGHGRAFREALLALWRREAGIEAWVALAKALGPGPAGDGGAHRGPEPVPPP